MADDVVVNPVTGVNAVETVAFDEIAAKKYQRVKLIHGADGTNAGDVSSANPLPVVQTGEIPAGSQIIGNVGAAFSSGTISNADVDALEDVATIAVGPYKTLGVTFTVATAALTEFVIQARVHLSGDFVTWYSTPNDFSFPKGLLLGTTSDLTVAGTSNVHGFLLDVSAFESVKIRAAGVNSVIAGHYGAK